jgi:hypothetical protein
MKMLPKEVLQSLLQARENYINCDGTVASFQDVIDAKLDKTSPEHTAWTRHVNELTTAWEKRTLDGVLVDWPMVSILPWAVCRTALVIGMNRLQMAIKSRFRSMPNLKAVVRTEANRPPHHRQQQLQEVAIHWQGLLCEMPSGSGIKRPEGSLKELARSGQSVLGKLLVKKQVLEEGEGMK